MLLLQQTPNVLCAPTGALWVLPITCRIIEPFVKDNDKIIERNRQSIHHSPLAVRLAWQLLHSPTMLLGSNFKSGLTANGILWWKSTVGVKRPI